MPKVASLPKSLGDVLDVPESSDSDNDEDLEPVEIIKAGTPQEYSGQVKNLVRMYEAFIKVMNSLVIFYYSHINSMVTPGSKNVIVF